MSADPGKDLGYQRGHHATLPAVLLKEPYEEPSQAGMSPRGHDPNTILDGSHFDGSGWNPDFRGEYYVGNAYQGFGGPVDTWLTVPGTITDWDPHQGLTVDRAAVISNPANPGDALQTTTLAELRAGQTIEFPTSGQMDPGFDPILLEIPFDQGNDVGWQGWFYTGRRMLFAQPPDYSAQTQPIAAAGLP